MSTLRRIQRASLLVRVAVAVVAIAWCISGAVVRGDLEGSVLGLVTAIGVLFVVDIFRVRSVDIRDGSDGESPGRAVAGAHHGQADRERDS